MTTAISLFLLFGAAFGLATYSNRHLFSEGPTARGNAQERGFLNGRMLWMLVCTFLWPILAMTGIHSLVLMARRRARAAQTARAPHD
jgi:hypothetical protein